jgi:hypothetical protein
VLGSIRSASKPWREEEDVPVRVDHAVIVNLPAPAVEALEGLAAKRETTKTEILRHATISLEPQLDHEIDQGAQILIEKDDKFSELRLRP